MKIQDLSKELSYDVFDLCNELKNVRREFEVSNQLKRCSTSVAANIQESQSAESKKDFIHKLRIARKECKETIYWLELVRDKIEVSLSIQPFISKYQQLSYLIGELRLILSNVASITS